MKFNLLEEAWIPVRRQSGSVEWIRPCGVVADDDTDPFVAFAAPRPDFNAGYTEFMIGLLQTCAYPDNVQDWRRWYTKAPEQTVLSKKLSTYAHCFNLVGDGPLFLQDIEELNQLPRPISALLIDYPGAKTIEDNKDHFVKRANDIKFGPEAAAIALFTLQSMAPAGGAGHRTSMRGGGPWITTLRSKRLWTTLWANVVDRAALSAEYPFMSEADLSDVRRIFPWMSTTRTSESGTGSQVLPTEVSPLQAYWGMPRRIRLSGSPTGGVDSVFERPANCLIDGFETTNYGPNYGPGWRHPLTPYRFDKDGESSPIKGSSSALSLRNWSRYTFCSNVEYDAALVARVTQDRLEKWEDLVDLRLFACGYDMDNMKARCWYEGQMPLFNVPMDLREDFEAQCQQLVTSFELFVNETHGSIKKALFFNYKPDPQTGKMAWSTRELSSGGNQRQRAGIAMSLENAVTRDFYDTCQTLLTTMDSEYAEEDTLAAKEEWLNRLAKHAIELFDTHVVPGSAAVEYAAIVRARFELRIFQKNSKVRKSLDLPTIKKEKA